MARARRGWLGVAIALIGVALGLAAAEAYQRLTQSQVLAMSLWYEPGIHRPDPRFGFAFQEHYRGLMEHVDRVHRVPIELDEFGYRLHAVGGEPPRRDVVFVGGVSMMFCYGLPDPDTITWQVAARSQNALRVWNAAWPGFGPTQTLIQYREGLGARIDPAVLVLALYLFDTSYDTVEAAWPPVSAERQAELFRYHPGIVVYPPGAVTRRLGRLAYGSMLAFEASRFLDGALPKPMLERLEPPAPAPAPEAEPLPTMPLRDWLAEVRDELAAEGTQLAVAFMPRGRTAADYYEPVVPRIPPGVAVLDAHRAIVERLGERYPTLGAGHYGRETAHAIGAYFAGEIDRLLEASPAQAGP